GALVMSASAVVHPPGPQPRFVVDPYLFGATALLALLGLVMVTSASISVADRELTDPFYHLRAQARGFGAGLFATVFCLAVPTRLWERTGFLALPLALVLLVLVLVPGIGHTVNGSTRWIRLPGLNLQPSEPARILLLVYLSSYLVRHADALRASFGGFLRPMLFIALAASLLLAEPDFGAATVLIGTAMGVLFIAGARLRDFVLLFGVAGGLLAALALSATYRVERLMAFLDPWADPFDTGFQLTQSLIAIGRGEWLGVGLGGSVQKLFYLPFPHTDFVFAVLAEELGLVGAAATIGLFVVVVWRAFAIARTALEGQRFFQGYLAYGLGLWVALQAFINIGVNMGVLPTKGLTLPLLSYGGSSLVVSMAALALLLRIHHENHAPTRRRRAPRSVR
ncbi:MAG: putative lipid II flippase FtsW, partial [Pseudomonadota bacterium]